MNHFGNLNRNKAYSMNHNRLFTLLNFSALVLVACNTTEPLPSPTPTLIPPTFTPTIVPPTTTPTITPTPTPAPVTIRIGPDSSGDFPSLEAAVDAVPSESTIILDAGTFHLTEILEINKSLRLVGAGIDKTEIVSGEENEGAELKAGLRLGGTATGIVQSCEITENNKIGIQVEDNAQVTLVENTCSNNQIAGIRYTDTKLIDSFCSSNSNCFQE